MSKLKTVAIMALSVVFSAGAYFKHSGYMATRGGSQWAPSGTKNNRKDKANQRLSFVYSVSDSIGVFRNRSTGKKEVHRIASTASATGSSAVPLTKSAKRHFGI